MGRRFHIYTVIFISLLFSPALPAQMEVTWGIPQKAQRGTEMVALLGSDGSFIYTLRQNFNLFDNHDPIVERYAMSDMAMNYSKRIIHRLNDGKQLQPEDIFFLQDNIIAFGSLYDGTTGENILYGELLDATCTVVQPWKEIARITAKKKNNSGSFFLGMAKDSSHILLVINPPFEKYADEKFTLQLLDNRLSSTWSHAVTLPYKDEFFSLDDFIASKSGDIYMLATISKDPSVMSRRDRRTTPTYYHNVLVVDHATDELTEYPLSLDPKFISDVKIEVNDSGNIICAGFYSNKTSDAIIGTFYFRIDKETKTVSDKGTMDFAQDFLVKFMSPKKVKSGKELYDYNLDYLVLRDDGGAVLVAEQFYEDVVEFYDPQLRMFTYTYYFNYNDIIVVSINPGGSIAWADKISKYQESRNDGGYYSSYAFAVSGDKMYFMFNDNPKNLGVKDEMNYKYMTNPDRSVAMLVTLNSKGEQDKQAMFTNKDLKIILRPKLFLQLDENTMALYGQRRKIYKLAKVKIK